MVRLSGLPTSSLMSLTPLIINPNTPLAFVTPQEAVELNLALCLRAITVGVRRFSVYLIK